MSIRDKLDFSFLLKNIDVKRADEGSSSSYMSIPFFFLLSRRFRQIFGQMEKVLFFMSIFIGYRLIKVLIICKPVLNLKITD